MLCGWLRHNWMACLWHNLERHVGIGWGWGCFFLARFLLLLSFVSFANRNDVWKAKCSSLTIEKSSYEEVWKVLFMLNAGGDRFKKLPSYAFNFVREGSKAKNTVSSLTELQCIAIWKFGWWCLWRNRLKSACWCEWRKCFATAESPTKMLLDSVSDLVSTFGNRSRRTRCGFWNWRRTPNTELSPCRLLTMIFHACCSCRDAFQSTKSLVINNWCLTCGDLPRCTNAHCRRVDWATCLRNFLASSCALKREERNWRKVRGKRKNFFSKPRFSSSLCSVSWLGWSPWSLFSRWKRSNRRVLQRLRSTGAISACFGDDWNSLWSQIRRENVWFESVQFCRGMDFEEFTHSAGPERVEIYRSLVQSGVSRSKTQRCVDSNLRNWIWRRKGARNAANCSVNSIQRETSQGAVFTELFLDLLKVFCRMWM